LKEILEFWYYLRLDFLLPPSMKLFAFSLRVSKKDTCWIFTQDERGIIW
jgi:hypothetical protein